MVAIKPGGCGVRYEKLAAVGIGTRVRHRKHPGAVVPEFRVDFIGEAVAGTACAGSQRAAPLNHKVIDYAVKGKAVKKRSVSGGGHSAFRQRYKVADRKGGSFVFKAD
jgi:hypothetical protein